MSKMHDTRVIAFFANPWDTSLTLAVECSDCKSQWRWTADRNGAHEELEAMAESHRRNFDALNGGDDE